MADKPYELSAADIDAAMQVALDAANAAADLMRECFERRRNGDASFRLDLETKSSSADLVTQYDKQCEDIVLERVGAFKCPVEAGSTEAVAFSILSEESKSDTPLTNFPTWVVDPIDGTTSFVHGSFDCGVSVGLAVNRQPLLGVIVLPELNQVITAIAGRGAFCNGKPLRVSGCTAPNRAVFCTHCPYNRSPAAMAALQGVNLELMQDHKVHALRSYGSAAMDMSSVAMGRLDCYFEVCIQAWDMCAAAVAVREAGGVLRDVEGGEFDLMRRGMVCAASPELADVAVALAKKYKYREAVLGSE